MRLHDIPRSVRSRAPLRLGLAGGGTDLSPYCDQHGGAVLNLTIDRYAYCFIGPSLIPEVEFFAADLRTREAYPCAFQPARGMELQLHIAVYNRMMRDHNGGKAAPLQVTTYVDAPPGSGLGSSSALVVAMVEAYRGFFGVPLGPYEVAQLAFEIERIDLGLAGGKQDQYAAAFGGANFIEFLGGDRVIVNPLRIGRATLKELEASLVICFTGVSRRSEAIIAEQQGNVRSASAEALTGLHQLKRDALDMKDALLRGDVGWMADILNRSWKAKKKTARGVSSATIDALFETARERGALAGKVSGAGGGGYMMLLVPPELRLELINHLNGLGARANAVNLTDDGAESWMCSDGTVGGPRVMREPNDARAVPTAALTY